MARCSSNPRFSDIASLGKVVTEGLAPPAVVGKSNEKAKKAMSNWKTIEAHHQAS